MEFSVAKAGLGMKMSVSQKVCLSVTLIFLSDLLVYFIIANRIEMKLRQSLSINRHEYKIIKELKSFKPSQTQVL